LVALETEPVKFRVSVLPPLTHLSFLLCLSRLTSLLIAERDRERERETERESERERERERERAPLNTGKPACQSSRPNLMNY